jgi:hypothetical protein
MLPGFDEPSAAIKGELELDPLISVLDMSASYKPVQSRADVPSARGGLTEDHNGGKQ